MKLKNKEKDTIIDKLNICFFDGTYVDKVKKGTTDITFKDYIDSVVNPEPRYIKQVELIRRVKASKTISEAKKLTLSSKIKETYNTKDQLYKALKWKAMHVYPSCTFDKQGCKYDNVTSVSGLMVYDLQGVDSDVSVLLKEWPHTVALHNSIGGGHGDFALFVYCPGLTIESFTSMWEQGDTLIQETFGLTPDNSDATKDLTRIRYLSYDPDCYYNPYAEPILVSSLVVSTTFTKNQENAIDKFLNSEPNWHKFGLALVVTKGENGRELFHTFSRVNKSKYDERETNRKYDRLLKESKTSKAGGITDATLFYLLKEMGVTYATPKTEGVRNVKNGRAEKLTIEEIIEYLNASWVRNEITDKLINFQTGHEVNIETIWTEFQFVFNEPKVSISMIQNILRSNRMNTINPFKNFFDEAAQKYKGGKYIDEYIKCLPLKDKEAGEVFIKTWLIHAYLQAYLGITNRLFLIFKGVTENIGKSRALGWLCPLDGYLKTGPILTDNKDTRIALAHNFLWNDDELKVFRGFDINKIKALISTDTINERSPYARSSETLRRLCSFAGSTNEDELLPSTEGNTRFLVVELLTDKLIKWNNYMRIDKQLFWGEVMQLHSDNYLSKTHNFMSDKRQEVNQGVTINSVLEDVINATLVSTMNDKNRQVMRLVDVIMEIDPTGDLKAITNQNLVRSILIKKFGSSRTMGLSQQGQRIVGYPVKAL